MTSPRSTRAPLALALLGLTAFVAGCEDTPAVKDTPPPKVEVLRPPPTPESRFEGDLARVRPALDEAGASVVGRTLTALPAPTWAPAGSLAVPARVVTLRAPGKSGKGAVKVELAFVPTAAGETRRKDEQGTILCDGLPAGAGYVGSTADHHVFAIPSRIDPSAARHVAVLLIEKGGLTEAPVAPPPPPPPPEAPREAPGASSAASTGASAAEGAAKEGASAAEGAAKDAAPAASTGASAVEGAAQDAGKAVEGAVPEAPKLDAPSGPSVP